MNQIEKQIKLMNGQISKFSDCTDEKTINFVNELKENIEIYERLNSFARANKLQVSVSPYSSSAYAFKKGQKIGWGEKPENSYRVSDHWNFIMDGKTHCVTSKNINGWAVCKMVNGIYETVEI